VDEVYPFLQAEGVSILLREGENELVFSASKGAGAGELIGQRIPASAGVAGEGIAGQVMAEGAVINVADTRTDPRYLPLSAGPQLRSLLAAPVESGSRRLGTLSITSTAPHTFSSDDERLLVTLGVQTGLANENARLFEDTRRQLNELTVLHAVAIAGAESTSEDALIEAPEYINVEPLTRSELCARVRPLLYHQGKRRRPRPSHYLRNHQSPQWPHRHRQRTQPRRRDQGLVAGKRAVSLRAPLKPKSQRPLSKNRSIIEAWLIRPPPRPES